MTVLNHSVVKVALSVFLKQGVKRVLYSYKILFFQTCATKSYKLRKNPIFSYILSLLLKNIQEIFKKLTKRCIGV